MILPRRGLLVPEIDVKKQLKLLRTRREVERLVCRSAAKSATPEEREVFAWLAAGFEKAASANDDVNFVRRGPLLRDFPPDAQASACLESERSPAALSTR